jgi:peptidyl-prolyl cis-trans isomerase B (cyclophilin B)
MALPDDLVERRGAHPHRERGRATGHRGAEQACHIDYRSRVANKDRQARTQQQLLRQYEARKAVHERQGARRRRDNIVAIGAIIVVATLAGLAQFFFFTAGPGMPTPVPTASSTPDPGADADAGSGNIGDVPDPSLAEGRTWTGTLTINDVPLGVELDGALAPQAASVLVEAAQTGAYLGTTCHRLVAGDTAQLLQCGSLDGTGAIDPAFSFGPLENTGVDGVYPVGSLAMARTGNDAYGNGRQFFIVTADSVLPDDDAGGYTIVGRVVSGLDALIAGVVAGGTVDGSGDAAPAVAATITGFTIQ